MRLRPYQLDCVQAIDEALWKNHSTLVEMATGCGKTVVFAHVASVFPGRILVIAHRWELIKQAADKIHKMTGLPVAIEMGMQSAHNELYGTKITVGSIQTLCKEKRHKRYHPDHFSLIIVDEGHHATSKTYRRLMNYFHSAKRLFVTATPKRSDQIALATVCESVAFQYGIEPAINDGWLVPVKQVVVKVDGLDFSKARTVAQDFNAGDLERILSEEKQLHSMVASAHEIIGTKQALWFCVSVAHAVAVGEVLNRYAPGKVGFVSGKTPDDERENIVKRYQSGELQHLTNCAIFLEGFDAPATSVIVMGRPTKSMALYMQVLGRGTRPLEGTVDQDDLQTPEGRRQAIAMSSKPDMTVIDYAGNAGRHKIIQATDVLGGKFPEEIREYAKETLQREGVAADIEEALDRAREEMALQYEESERRKHILAKASYKTQEISPFVNQYNARRSESKQPQEPCTKKQAGLICYLSRKNGGPEWSFDDAINLTKKQAQGVIGKLQRGQAG